MHETLVFVGVEIVAAWFGHHWGTSGAVVAGLLGLVIASALASTMDGFVSTFGAIIRWAALLVATSTIGYAIGLAVDYVHEGKAH